MLYLEQLLALGPCWVTESASEYHTFLFMKALSGFLGVPGKHFLIINPPALA